MLFRSEQSSRGVATIKALLNLALAVGGLYAPLTGQGNGQGGREHGQKNDQLPGYQSIENPAARAYISDLWGISESELPHTGLSAQELLEACGSPVRGLLVLGSNPVVSAANSLRVTRALGALEHLVVIDCYLSETAQLADVVLPGNMWLEEDGTMTNLEGRVLRRRQVMQPPPGARADWRILCELSALLGVGEKFAFASPEEIFTELALATKGGPADYSGISYPRLEPDGIFAPCPSIDHPGTPRPFVQSFAHADGKAHLEPVVYQVLEGISAAQPIFFTTGRNAHQYQSGTQTRRNAKLNPRAPHATLELHPNLAREHGVQAGDAVTVSSGNGTATFEAVLNAGIREDTVYAPFHYAGAGNANRLTGSSLDPISRMPDFKVTPVTLEPALTAVPLDSRSPAKAPLDAPP